MADDLRTFFLRTHIIADIHYELRNKLIKRFEHGNSTLYAKIKVRILTKLIKDRIKVNALYNSKTKYLYVFYIYILNRK
jgi:DnaJ-class molecular chaperone